MKRRVLSSQVPQLLFEKMDILASHLGTSVSQVNREILLLYFGNRGWLDKDEIDEIIDCYRN